MKYCLHTLPNSYLLPNSLPFCTNNFGCPSVIMKNRKLLHLFYQHISFGYRENRYIQHIVYKTPFAGDNQVYSTLLMTDVFQRFLHKSSFIDVLSNKLLVSFKTAILSINLVGGLFVVKL